MPKQRLKLARRVVERGWSLTRGGRGRASRDAEGSERTARKRVARYREQGEVGLSDRSSAPASQPGAMPDERVEAIAALRRLRLTGAGIAAALGIALSTVQGILTRIGLGKLSRLEPPGRPTATSASGRASCCTSTPRSSAASAARAQATAPLAGAQVGARRGPGRRSRGAGWEFVHICVDDATRLAYVEVLEREGEHLRRVLAQSARLLPLAWDPRRARDDRQRPRLSLDRSRASSTSAPAPTGRARTARPSGSSAPCWPAAATAPPTAPRPSAAPRSPAGSTSTIAADHTARSATKRR
jgi:leucine-zipper of insertion element IS481